MAKITNSVFNALCVAFSAVFLVLCMLCSAQRAAENERVAQYKKEVDKLKTENQVLYVQNQCYMSLEELEKYALETLGMQRLNPSQIFYIEYIG